VLHCLKHVASFGPSAGQNANLVRLRARAGQISPEGGREERAN
jgi:hypothetical protein